MTGSGDPSLASATNLVKHKVEGLWQDTEPASPIFHISDWLDSSKSQ